MRRLPFPIVSDGMPLADPEKIQRRQNRRNRTMNPFLLHALNREYIVDLAKPIHNIAQMN